MSMAEWIVTFMIKHADYTKTLNACIEAAMLEGIPEFDYAGPHNRVIEKLKATGWVYGEKDFKNKVSPVITDYANLSDKDKHDVQVVILKRILISFNEDKNGK